MGMDLELFTTFGKGGWQEQFRQVVALRPDTRTENQVINLYPELTYGAFEGFGGAVTDSAGYVYAQMDEQQKQQFMEMYFSPERMNYRLLRVPIDSCDFSLRQYEAMSDPTDRELKSFSLAREGKYIFPMLEDIRTCTGRPPELMLSPWSPPRFMKDNRRRVLGGRLKPEYRDFWAEYLCRYILEFQERGYVVRRISLQNEPHAVTHWDSCVYTAQEQKIFLRDHMYPAMVRHGLEDVEIFLWDHNKERLYEWVRDVIDEETAHMVAGAAFHWYSGDHFESLDMIRERYPDMKLVVSESCVEFHKADPRNIVQVSISLARELIGDLNHGITAFYDWNLLLDQNGGPNHVGNHCMAPVLFDTERKELKPQLIQQYFEHFSHYIRPKAVRIGHSCYTEDIEVTSWKCPDGGIVVVMLNKSRHIRPVCIRMDGQAAKFLLYPQSISTGVFA